MTVRGVPGPAPVVGIRRPIWCPHELPARVGGPWQEAEGWRGRIDLHAERLAASMILCDRWRSLLTPYAMRYRDEQGLGLLRDLVGRQG